MHALILLGTARSCPFSFWLLDILVYVHLFGHFSLSSVEVLKVQYIVPRKSKLYILEVNLDVAIEHARFVLLELLESLCWKLEVMVIDSSFLQSFFNFVCC